MVAKDDSGWWTGRTDDGREGDFPFNYVEVLDDAATQAYLKKKAGEDDGLALSGERVDTIQVVSHKKGGQYVLESSTSLGTREQVVKQMKDLRAFDAQLRTVIPNFEGSLPPAWADVAILSDKMAERRKDAVNVYLQKVVQSDGADFLMIPFLFSGKSVQLSEEGFAAAARAQKLAKDNPKKPEEKPMLARAEYAWDPQDTVELSLDGGEIVAVVSQMTGSEGWWEGQTADGARGLFPFNHVEVLAPPEAALFLDGKPMPPPPQPQASTTEKVRSKEKQQNADRKIVVVPNFGLASLQSFDDVIDKGYSVENMAGGNGAFPKVGDKVTVAFKAHVWDCQMQAILEFLASDDPQEGPMEFVLGDDSSIVQGLHKAMEKISVGAKARIIIEPRLGYGVAGFPPAIPPNAHLVYDVHLTSCGPGKSVTGTPKMKPEVQARKESVIGSSGSKPRVISMRGMAPVADRPDVKPSPAKAADKSTPISAAPSVDHSNKETARRAGHVMVSTSAAAGGNAPGASAVKKEVKKYDLAQLQELVKNGKLEANGLNRLQLEDYLNDKAFFEAFLMDRGHFLLKPQWRQQALKRAVGLF